MRRIFLILFLLKAAFYADASTSPEVALSHNGKVKGTTMTSLDEREFFAFRGIPYGKPPVGSLRFKAPEIVDPWEGVRDASEEASPCAQVALMGGDTFIGSEDCLYLNVYTPKLAKKESGEMLPVVFWIHGGAFYAGDGGVQENGPEFLMDQDIVLVTINYRLGAFGFLSSGDQKIPGNFGMKDQVMALQWVQDNIRNFGGDKDKVLIWGYSSGAACVQAHLFSEMSKGLFSSAIYQSGSLHSQCALRSKPNTVLQVLGSIVKCEQMEIVDQLECLRELPASELAKSINSFPYWGMKIPSAFTVVQEFPDFRTKEWTEAPFLTEDPNKMLADGRIVNDVPTISGMAQDEGIPIGFALRENPDLYKQADKHFADVARLGSCLYGITSKKKFDKIKKFYFGDSKIDISQFENFIKFHSDALFNFGLVETALKQASASSSPVYFYLFTFEGRISEAMAFGLTPIKGVSHADDLAYIFRRRVPFPGGPNEKERATIKRMGKIVENFARTGRPIPDENGLFGIKWDPVKEDDFKYLEINTDLQMHKGFPFAERIGFWQNLLKKKKKVVKEEL